MPLNFSFDKKGFQIDGQDAYMVSGEFHYFRVPRSDWRRRMQLFKQAKGNCIATYVPWLIHEPEEGDIRFDDIDNRNLTAFLKLAQEEGLKVVLRPGPYQYSELVNDGLPEWLLVKYPEIQAKDVHGNSFRHSSVSYLHPVFLKKTRKYYRAFADVVRPFMMENGGPVCMLQVDNELTGIHVWFGGLDYNPDSMGFGKADGRYPRWLEKKYGTVEQLNRVYGTEFLSFADVHPIAEANSSDLTSCLRVKDYHDFYRATIAEYACILAGWLREDGLGGPICHNSPNPQSNALFQELTESMGEHFLLGSDHYYTLNPNWRQNNPTPQYAIRVMVSCDTMRALGMPPAVLEMPGGSASDTPPMLKEDILACYMANLALGMKGVNYYVYTGGVNFPGTGATHAIYDYHALVHADGTLNETYESLKTFGEFMDTHRWMQRAHRVASVQIGFEWDTLRSEKYDYSGFPMSGAKINTFLEKTVLYALMCSHYSPEMVLLTGELDITRPLIVPTPSVMSEKGQKAVIDFVKRGGKVLILPGFPEADSEYQPCNLFAELLGEAAFSYHRKVGPVIDIDQVCDVYGISEAVVCEQLPENARILAADKETGSIMGFEMPVGNGKLLWFGGIWSFCTFDQSQMLEHFIKIMDGEECVASSNRNIFTSLWTDENGHRIVFVMNLYSGKQKTDIHVYVGGEYCIENIQLQAMEVRYFEL